MYRKLLIGERIRASTRGAKPLVEEVESDRARVLYSASFRRLQRKTQVFPLENNASVRTRLTHSLEVAHVGRFIAATVIEEFKSQKLLADVGLDGDYAQAFVTNVEVACLLHDIGNPPFGHFGEIAISKWVSGFDEPLKSSDLSGFDGNPQGFRIVTKLAGADGLTGMNLTYTQLASILKYPSLVSEKSRYKKFGVFDSERKVISEIREKFELKPEQRFPLAYLMEAADDISYCLSDIEDGVEKGILTYDEVIRDLNDQCKSDLEVKALLSSAESIAGTAPAVDKVVSFRSALIRGLVEYSAKTYVDRHAEIIDGSLKELISSESAQGRLLSLIKDVMRAKVYSDSSIQSLELAGLAVITGILDRFKPLLLLNREAFKSLAKVGARPKGLDIEKRLYDYFAPRHKTVYESCTEICTDLEEREQRARMIVDYVSGMTDLFALETHQILGGTQL